MTIFPIGSSPIVKIPSESPTRPLLSAALLLCGIDPSTLVSQENYTTRWITPDGEIIDIHLTERFVFIEDNIPVDTTGTRTVPGTALLVKQLSYLDDGTVYTCEGRGTAFGDFSPWASATIELKLCCKYISISFVCSYSYYYFNDRVLQLQFLSNACSRTTDKQQYNNTKY